MQAPPQVMSYNHQACIREKNTGPMAGFWRSVPYIFIYIYIYSYIFIFCIYLFSQGLPVHNVLNLVTSACIAPCDKSVQMHLSRSEDQPHMSISLISSDPVSVRDKEEKEEDWKAIFAIPCFGTLQTPLEMM